MRQHICIDVGCEYSEGLPAVYQRMFIIENEGDAESKFNDEMPRPRLFMKKEIPREGISKKFLGNL